MNWKKRRIPAPGQSSPLWRLLILALFFLLGVALGQVVLEWVPDETGAELKQYLEGYLSLSGESASAAAALPAALVLYIRYPLLAFFLGFASIGVVLLPCAALAFGFFLSFSVCCFTASFGGDGVVLALAVLGVRCAVTLPCFFLLADASMETSAALARASFGRGRHTAPVVYGRRCWIRLGIVLAAVTVGLCVELLLSPRLLTLALERAVI